jgi:hypothetical protein
MRHQAVFFYWQMKHRVLQETNTESLLVPLNLFSEIKNITSYVFLAIVIGADILYHTKISSALN